MVHNLEHLFLVGEYPERARLLSGLTLEQVTLCPDGASHSIYEELWHVAGYQQSILVPGEPAVGDLSRARRPSMSTNGTTWYECSWKALALRQRWGRCLTGWRSRYSRV